MKNSVLFLVFFLMVGAPKAHSASLVKSEADVDKTLTQFLTQVKEGHVHDAVETFKALWPNVSKNEMIKMETEIIDANKVNGERFGKPVGVEKVRSCKVGSFLYKSQAVVKFEKGFVFWNFSFYNSGAGWQMSLYRFNNTDFVPLTDTCIGFSKE